MVKYDYVKEQLSAKEVVKDILGEPQRISGESYMWTSPFRDGDTDPSLSANDIQITDFGGDFKGDIFNFVARYNNITNSEALDYIIEEYNIEIPGEIENTSMTTTNKDNTHIINTEVITTSYELEPSEETTEEIIAMFDTTSFTRKPEGKELGGIKNRIPKLEPYVYNLDGIKNEIITGHTCIPAGIKSQRDWQDSQNHLQIFMVDIDNTINLKDEKQNIMVDDERHITVDKIVKYCEEINLVPTFVYYTFSHSQQQHKFRLVYVLEKATQQQEEVKGIYQYLKDIFKDYNIDTAPTSIATLFLGGQSIAYESNKFYKIKAIEHKRVVSKVEVIDNHELGICMNSLKGSQYVINNGKVGILKKDTITAISNFIVYMTEKIKYINGADTETKYIANCILLENPTIKLPTQKISVEQYSKFDFILGSSWDKFAIISAGNSNSERLREITQLISRNTMTEKEAYSHMGFTKIDDKLVYLYHGGIIGDIENIEVDLSTDKLERFHFTNKIFETAEALKCSMSTLELADKKITIPLLATIYLSPLYSILSEEKIHADYILVLEGRTGSKKSTLAALMLSHFGEFDRDHFPSSFRDTINSIEKKSYIIKDAVNVVDDFNPEINAKYKLEIMERLYAMYGDRTGRTRMSRDGSTLKIPYTARGLCIVTGESKPDVAQSRIARSLIINMKKDSLDEPKLSALQNKTEQLAFCMMKYIEWIIKNEQKIREYIKTNFYELREKQNSNNHGRTNEIINVLTIGFTMFLQFLLDNNVISIDKKQELEETAYNTLNQLVEEQTQEIEELKPTEMFYNAVEQLLVSKSIKILDYKTEEIIEENSYSGEFVGFLDKTNNCYYFLPDIIYQNVLSFYNKQGIKFPLNKTSLWKYLLEEDLLVRNDEKRYTMQRSVNKKMYTVVGVKLKNKIFTDTDDTNNVNPYKWKKPKNNFTF